MKMNKKALRLLQLFFVFKIVEWSFKLFHIPLTNLLDVIGYLLVGIIYVLLLRIDPLKRGKWTIVSYFIIVLTFGWVMQRLHVPFNRYLLIPGMLGVAISYAWAFIDTRDYRAISYVKLILVELYAISYLSYWLFDFSFPYKGILTKVIECLLFVAFFYDALFQNRRQIKEIASLVPRSQ